jgi:hypothetical protein
MVKNKAKMGSKSEMNVPAEHFDGIRLQYIQSSWAASTQS